MGKIHSEVQTVTSELAKLYLAKSRGNRNLSLKKVNQYASDMGNGHWQVTHQGIAFDESGVLKDGHHRLHAVIKAGVPVDMLVIENISCEATLFDRGRPRDTRQFLIYNEGLPSYLTDNTAIAIANLHFHMLHKTTSDFDVKDFLLDNRDTMLLTMKNLSQTKEKSRSGIKNAALGYAIFCALKCGVSSEVLQRFTHVVATGFSDGPEEYAAVVARNQLLAFKGMSGRGAKQDLCKNCQAAIKDFVCGASRKKPYSAKEAYYTNLWLSSHDF